MASGLLKIALRVSLLFFFVRMALNLLSSPDPKAPEAPQKTPALHSGTPDLEPAPLPVLFLSHGGPTFIFRDDEYGNKAAWDATRALGRTIKNSWKPDYIVVVSAHWQLSGRNLVEVAVPPSQTEAFLQKREPLENPLIYDFYGFPDKMYKQTFRTRTSPVVARAVAEQVEKAGFLAQQTERGIDHGVWVPFKVAFLDDSGSEWVLPDTPLVQVLLPGLGNDFDANYRLGQALGNLARLKVWDPHTQRNLRGLVICSGMSVHNLRDFRQAMGQKDGVMPYVAPFSRLLLQLVQQPDVLALLKELKTKHADLLYLAHPTLEHFAPLVVAAGGNGSPGTELFNAHQLSLGWGIYQFGPDPITT